MKQRCWYMFAVSYSEAEQQIIASFISLDAVNRHLAFLDMKRELATSPKWLDEHGHLLPFLPLEFGQCKPTETEQIASLCLEKFHLVVHSLSTDQFTA